MLLSLTAGSFVICVIDIEPSGCTQQETCEKLRGKGGDRDEKKEEKEGEEEEKGEGKSKRQTYIEPIGCSARNE